MKNRRRRSYGYSLLPLGLFVACTAGPVLPSEDTPHLGSTSAAVSNGIRVGCEVVVGNAPQGPTVDFCMSADGNGITRIDFMTDILNPVLVGWKFDFPRDEPLQVLSWCHRGTAHCSIVVFPRCDGEMRQFRVMTTDYGGLSGEAMAMIPRATSCPTAAPPRKPRPPVDSDFTCVTEVRGTICGGPPELPDQCDGIDGCVDCVNNGGCSESGVCSISSATCVDFDFPQPPEPPLPRPLPPPDVAGWPDPASTDCTGRARGIICNFPRGASVPDQCDGNGRCVDCLSDTGCNEQSICSAQQTCTPKVTTPPPSNVPGMDTWVALMNALNAGQRDAALNLFFTESRPKYDEIFRELGTDIQTLSRDWSTPEAVRVGSSFVTYLVMDNADNGGTGHLVTLVQEDGRWVVDQL